MTDYDSDDHRYISGMLGYPGISVTSSPYDHGRERAREKSHSPSPRHPSPCDYGRNHAREKSSDLLNFAWFDEDGDRLPSEVFYGIGDRDK